MTEKNPHQYLLTRTEITALLEDLGRLLDERGVTGSLYVFGGASIALTVDGRRSTTDIDAVIAPANEVLCAARDLARARGIPESWLNDAGRGFVPDRAQWDECLVMGGLRVWNATPAMVLAMKQATTRLKDFADLAVCYEAAGYTSVREAVAAFHRFYPDGLAGRTPTDEELVIDLEEALRQEDRSRLPDMGTRSVASPLADEARPLGGDGGI